MRSVRWLKPEAYRKRHGPGEADRDRASSIRRRGSYWISNRTMGTDVRREKLKLSFNPNAILLASLECGPVMTTSDAIFYDVPNSI